ncbi:MAG: PAS domain-containing protein [Planctomycetota bacterium]|jgi:PAS domain S-box-containing protein
MAAKKPKEGISQGAKRPKTPAAGKQGFKPFQSLRGEDKPKVQYEKIPLNTMSAAETTRKIHELQIRIQELEESNRLLQQVLESGSSGTWNFDVQTGRFEWNRQMYEIVGLSPDVKDITIESFFNYIHPEDLPGVKEKFSTVLESGTDFKEIFRIVRANGEVRWLLGRGRVFRDEQARPVQMIVVYVDITEYQQTTEAMRLERQRLRNILDSIPDAVYIVNRRGEIEYINPEMEKQHGLWTDKKCYQYRLGTDEPCESCEFDRIRSGRTVRAEWTDEKIGKTYDCIDAPLTNLDGSISKLKIMRNITERKKAENALRLHEIRLEALLGLNKMEGASRMEILDFVREEIIKITQSQFAFMGFMNEGESIMSIECWSKEAMRQCSVVDLPVHFPVTKAGLWGEVIRQRKAIIVNDYSSVRSKKGYPEGHVPIKRFLSVPVFDIDRIVAVAAVANKQEDYEESDIRALTSMMNDTWRLIQRRRAREQVENLARFPSENPFPVLRIAEDGTILYSNDGSSALLNKWKRKVGQLAPNDWRQLVGIVLDSNRNRIIEVRHQDRIVSFVLAPVAKAGYVNVYGRDVTEQKKAEQALKEARDDLEDKVRQRTAELSDVVNALRKEARERSLAQQELQQSESRLRSAQQIAHIGNWDWDIINNTLWWSDEIYRIFGLEPGQFGVTYEAFLSYVHPDDRELVKAAVNEAVYNHETYNIDHRLIRPDGAQRTVHERAKVVYDEEKKPVRMIGTVQDITEFKQAEERILADQVALRSLTSELQLAEERERRRLARDLHDSLGQILAMSRMELIRLQKSAPAEIVSSLKIVADQLGQAVKETRTLSFELSPSVLYDLGFEVAIEDLAERFARDRNIKCRFENSDEPKPLEEAVAVLLYRSVRELLINVAKHANGTAAKVSLERIEGKLRITVEDNGDGFDVSTLDNLARESRGFGVMSIRERLRHIGGYFEIQSGNGTGTKVTLIAPTYNKESTEQDGL